ncbi:MAG: hypothetical protein J0H57_05030, partial [Rhodospirillales bacterium]|nr:hypothetical protein [Rhodospirillales bacterium]
MAERLVLCCGNPDRGDDGVGWSVAAQLRGMAVPGLRVVAMRGAAAELLDAMNGEADVVLVDAA